MEESASILHSSTTLVWRRTLYLPDLNACSALTLEGAGNDGGYRRPREKKLRLGHRSIRTSHSKHMVLLVLVYYQLPGMTKYEPLSALIFDDRSRVSVILNLTMEGESFVMTGTLHHVKWIILDRHARPPVFQGNEFRPQSNYSVRAPCPQ